MTTSIAPGFDPTALPAPARRESQPEPAGEQSFAAAMESQDRTSRQSGPADRAGAPNGPGNPNAERGGHAGERQAAGRGDGGQGPEDSGRSDRQAADAKAQDSGKAAAKDAEGQAETAKSAADDRAKGRGEAAAKTAAEAEQAKATAKTLADETAALVQAAKGRANAQAQQSAAAAKSQAQAAKAANQVAAAAGKAGSAEGTGQGRETVIAGQRVRLSVTGGEGRGQAGGRPLNGATAVAASAAGGQGDKAGDGAKSATAKGGEEAEPKAEAREGRSRLRRDPAGLVQRESGRAGRGETGPAGRFAEAVSGNARDGAQSPSAARLQAAAEGAAQSAGRAAEAAAAARAEGGATQTAAQSAAQGAGAAGSQTFDPVMNGTGPASGTGQTGASEAARAAQNPGAPRPTPNAPPAEQVAVQIQRAAANGQQRVQIRLHPAELGRIDVKLDMADDGTVRAVLAVDKPETLDLMQRDPRALEKALQAAGLKTDSGSLSFNLREDDRGGQQQAGNGDGNPAASGPAGAPSGQADDGDLLAADSLRAGLGDGRVDIRV
jgi:flagellar hook-length control protein FliK